MEKLTCKERDAIFGDGSTWGVFSSLTDMHGTYGMPVIDTTWERGAERLWDIKHPNEDDPNGPDRKPCEHYYYVVAEQEQE